MTYSLLQNIKEHIKQRSVCCDAVELDTLLVADAVQLDVMVVQHGKVIAFQSLANERPQHCVRFCVL